MDFCKIGDNVIGEISEDANEISSRLLKMISSLENRRDVARVKFELLQNSVNSSSSVCRFRKALQNNILIIEIRFDAAKNELSEARFHRPARGRALAGNAASNRRTAGMHRPAKMDPGSRNVYGSPAANLAPALKLSQLFHPNLEEGVLARESRSVKKNTESLSQCKSLQIL